MKIDEIRKLSDEQIVNREQEVEKELSTTIFRHRTGQLQDKSKLGKLRKEISRLQTVAREREISASLPKGFLKQRYTHTHKGKELEQAAAGERPKDKKGFLKGIIDRLSGSE